MKAKELYLNDFRHFNNASVMIGNRVTAIAGNNGTGKSTILGLLANSSQLTGHSSYLGKSYRGEFSELFTASEEHDPSGKKIELRYEEHGEAKEMWFRTGWQKKANGTGRRFRVIPKRENPKGGQTESKLVSPVIYLGLSRLYPIGEIDKGGIEKIAQKWDDEADELWFRGQYAQILSIHDEINSVNTLSLSDVSRKRGTGIETDSYGPTVNSAGQDNLGQILLAMLSFRRAKRELADKWDGGLLLIDEVDATLHPAAQLRLLKTMIDESAKTGYQIIFTTHSTVILREMSCKNQHNKANEPGDIEVAYLTDANRNLVVKRNPSWRSMETDLLVKSAGYSAPVGVFSEDAEARWFIEQLVDELCPELNRQITIIEAPMGCKQLMTLYVQDFPYLRDRIVVFDGDVTEASLEEKIPKGLKESARNIVKLPGSVRPEEVIWDYLVNSDTDDSVWEALELYDLSWRQIRENGPDSQEYAKFDKDRDKFKAWFHNHRDVFSCAKVIHFWCNANQDAAQQFMVDFRRAFDAVAGRTSTSRMPMAKRGEMG